MRRYLKGNSGTEVPESVFFVDTETKRKSIGGNSKSWLEIFRMGVVRHCRMRDNELKSVEEMVFWKVEHFWNFLFSHAVPRRSNWVFAHNLGFDLQVLNVFDKLLSGELSIFTTPAPKPRQVTHPGKTKPWRGTFNIDGLPAFMRTRHSGTTIIFADTMNYFRNSLEELGEKIGLPKGTLPTHNAIRDTWESYCRRDVEIIQELMIPMMRHWKDAKLGNWNYTAPGLAFNNYRHAHAPKTTTSKGIEKVAICLHDNEQAKELERKAYHGGEIQCFYYGIVSPEKPQFDPRPWVDDYLYHLDCRSLFPFAMRDALYPVALERYYDRLDLANLRRFSSSKGVIAEVYLETPNLPFVVRHEGAVKYARGNFWTVLCADELGRAIADDLVRDIGRVAVYQVEQIFRSYVNHWYREREKAKAKNQPHMDQLAKMMLNSLYGKFAQKSPRWVDEPDMHRQCDWGEFLHLPVGATKFEKFRSFAGNVQRRVESKDGPNSFCAISAFVTSNAREYMRRVREICPYRSIYYQHTDSLICNAGAYAALKRAGLLGDKIGQFREFQESSSYAEFFGPGDYVLGNREVQSGTKRNAKKVGHELIEQDEFHGLTYQITHGPREGVIGHSVTIRRNPERWRLHSESNGWAEPFTLTTPRIPIGLPPLLQL
jgi:hypothetical protein